MSEKRARIVHVTTLHRPLDVRIFEKECRTLVAAGHEVHLVANDPPAPERDGVRFHRLHRPAGQRGAYPAALREAWRRTRALAPDVVHLHDTELIPLGLAFAATGTRVVYDVHEDAAEEARTIFRTRPAWAFVKRGAIRAYEAAARRAFHGFVCATPHIAEQFPPERSVTLPNYPLLDEFPADDLPGPQREDGVALYVGTLFPSRGVFEMLDALQRARSRRPLRMRWFGSFESPALRERAEAHPGWAGTAFGGWLDRKGVAREMATASLGLVLLHPEPSFRVALPVKLFEYMAAALPVVASDFPLWRDIVKGAGCGLLVDPLDPEEIAEAMLWLEAHPDEARRMGERGRRAVQERYHWQAVAPTLLRCYEAVLAG